MRFKRLMSTVTGLVTTREQRFQGYNYLYLKEGTKLEKLGIFTYGPCDVGGIFAVEPFVKTRLNGECGILRGGYGAASTRTDIILQTLETWPDELLEPIFKNLKLNPGYFKPTVFEPTFTLQTPTGKKVFKKDLICLSVGPDLVRTAYQHRESGLVVDPGGWWLNQKMDHVLSDLSALSWFNKNFKKIGRIPLENWVENFTKIINLLQQKTTARILVFNMLAVEPGAQHYNYQFVKSPETIRRRQFNLALVEMSSKLGFSILDVDKVLKGVGVKEQVDFGHCPIDRFAIVAEEIVRIMVDCQLLGRSHDTDKRNYSNI